MTKCELEYMPHRDKAFCKTHKRFEEQCFQAEIKELKAAIEKYGDHTADCDFKNSAIGPFPPKDCDCGLLELLAEIAPKKSWEEWWRDALAEADRNSIDLLALAPESAWRSLWNLGVNAVAAVAAVAEAEATRATQQEEQ